MQLRLVKRLFVPRFVFFLALQTEIRAEVDEQLAGGQALFCERFTESVRQGSEYHIRVGNSGICVGQCRQCAFFEVRIDRSDLLSRKGNGRQPDDLGIWMGQQQPDQFRARVSRGTYNGCTDLFFSHIIFPFLSDIV